MFSKHTFPNCRTFLIKHFICFFFLTGADAQRQNLPDLSETSSKPIRVSVGDDLNIDCLIKNRNNLTILWKYVNGSMELLLAANQVIVSDDKRMSVIHESCKFGKDLFQVSKH